jgi:hypothetical protein
MHFNVQQCNVWITETGERVKVIETTNDILGACWILCDSLNKYNGVPDMYNVPDGWLNDYLPDVLPDEGVMIDMNWRFVAKGIGNFSMSTMMVLHRKANGEVAVDMVKSHSNCNE